MNDNLEGDPVETLLKILGAVALPLVAYDGPMPIAVVPGTRVGLPVEFATGFLVERGGICHVVTASHAVEDHYWYIELRIEVVPEWESRAVLVPIPTPVCLRRWLDVSTGRSGEIDVAWAAVDLRASLRHLDPRPRSPIACRPYRGPLDARPSTEDVYSFLAFNNPASYPGPRRGTTILERRACVELGLEYRGNDADGNYRFALNRPHPGHDHYRGASGAPIVDGSGVIVAVLIKGVLETNELIGTPVADFSMLLG